MFFFPQDTLRRNQAKKMFEVIVAKEGMEFLGWRKVPVCPEVLGQKALSKMPNIQQAFVKRPGDAARGLEFDRRLYVARRVFEQSNDNTYVPSLSSRTVVYKGMFLVGELRKFYLDLQSRDYHSAIACVHSRFSTNTNPSWERAHPNRLIPHNGEINTIRGNADRMLAREETMSNPVIDDALDKIYPVVNGAGSDSAMLDNTLEFLVMSGMDLPLAVMVTIPEPWTKDGSISRAKRDLYQYYAIMMEPWDGPASILFSDGDAMGAVLDRNGLRPSRYYITDDGKLILSSEVGAALRGRLLKKLVGDLEEDAHAVTGLSLSVLSRSMLQLLHDFQRTVHRLIALAALDVHHGSDAAGIVLKRRVIQAALLIAFSVHLDFPFPGQLTKIRQSNSRTAAARLRCLSHTHIAVFHRRAPVPSLVILQELRLLLSSLGISKLCLYQRHEALCFQLWAKV